MGIGGPQCPALLFPGDTGGPAGQSHQDTERCCQASEKRKKPVAAAAAENGSGALAAELQSQGDGPEDGGSNQAA